MIDGAPKDQGRLGVGPTQPGMTLYIEALISPEGGDFWITFDDQVSITRDGFEHLTTYPHDAALMGTYDVDAT